jgi:hypothetical protein
LRGRVHEELQYLASKGYLKLNWRKYEHGNLLESIDLINRQVETIEYLCTQLGRTPLNIQRTELRIFMHEQERRSGWFDSFLSWAIAQLEAYRSPAPLSFSDLQMSRDLLRALSAIAQLEAPTLARRLSIELFGSSKRLEELLGKVVVVLRAHAPDAVVYGDDEWALLQAYKVCRPSEYIPLAGPLSLMIHKAPHGDERPPAQLHIDPALPSICLSEEILREAVITSCPATALITIENQTSFSELLQVRPPTVLVIFTGGFASPALISFLRAIRKYQPELPVLHWGDIDVGGLSILVHLRRQLGAVHSLCMNVEVLSFYQAYAQPLTSADKKGLQLLLSDTELEDCAPLIHHMIKHQFKLEQEAVRAERVLASLSLQR